jgi:hypothetical protein
VPLVEPVLTAATDPDERPTTVTHFRDGLAANW